MGSQVFASRPRSTQILRFLVEESIRNGFKPVSQRLIATHGLGFSDDFSPSRSAEVRVKIARLRDAINRYYEGPGRHDPVVLGVSQGPYRLLVTSNGAAAADDTIDALRQTRCTRPLLVVVEPEVIGESAPDGFGLRVSLRLLSLLVEDSLVTVSGPMLQGRIAATGESPLALARQNGYDYAVETVITVAEPRWLVRLTITDTKRGEVAANLKTSFDPQAHAGIADDVGTWIYHRIGATFAVRE